MANRHFGRNAVIKMYHQGRTPITQPQQINNIHGNDVVVIVPEQQRDEGPGLTTHQEHYVQHPLEARPAAARRPTTPGPAAKFEGNTSYAIDYVEHPLEPRKAVQAPRQAWDRNSGEATGKSMYATHYPWHDVMPRTPQPRTQRQLIYPAAEFEGVTSYNTDFVKHPLARPRTPVNRRAERMDVGPFEGTTTYALDYQRPEPQQPDTSRTSRGQHRLESVPFEGCTEYHREYIKKEVPGRLVVHLEPELRSSRGLHSRGQSAPAPRR